MTDKVIEFPKSKVVRELPEEIHKARAKKADQKFADSVVDEICGIVLTELDNYDIQVEDKSFSKDFVLVVDSLRACIYRSLDLDHHLHAFIDDNVKVIEGSHSLSKDEQAEKITEMIQEMAKEKIDTKQEE